MADIEELPPSPPPPRRRGFLILMDRLWWVSAGLLAGPILLAWGIRGVAYAMDCQPAAAACVEGPFGNVMGEAFKDFLDLAWLMGATTVLTPLLTSIATAAAVFAARPVRAALTALLLPLVALLFPITLVEFSTYQDCIVAVDATGSCVLWGSNMGAAFSRAGTAAVLVYSYTPFAVAGALGAFIVASLVLLIYRQFRWTG